MSIVFSSDSKQTAIASSNGTVKIWEAKSERCQQTLESSHLGHITSMAFSHDSKQLATTSEDGTAKIWEVSSGNCLQTLDIGRAFFNISFDSTNQLLHTDISTLSLDLSQDANAKSGTTDVQILRYHGIAISPDGRWITYNSENLLLLPSEYRPSCSAMSDKVVAIGCMSGNVWILNFNMKDD